MGNKTIERTSKISGYGCCLPERILTNSDLEKMVETSDEWIVKRTGIKERRITQPDVFASDLGIKAAEKALINAGMKADELDLIIVATVSPDKITPSVSCLVQKGIAATKASAFDINVACSGFVSGIVIADQFIRSGYYNNVMVIGTDTLSKVTDYEDRNTCVLFGDGAGAIIMTPSYDSDGIVTSELGADGSIGHNLTLPFLSISDFDSEKRVGANKQTIWMDGSEVFKFAVRIMAEATVVAVEKAGLSVSDIDLLIPHQANVRIVDGAVKRIGLPAEKVFVNLDKYGNMSTASIAVAFCEAMEQGRCKKGDHVVLVGFGGGLTWASVVIKL